jgi:choline-sulfatase
MKRAAFKRLLALPAVGADFLPQDANLPGESLWDIAQDEDRARSVFAEFHAVYSPTGSSMLRTERYKYVHYVGYPPQLFDMLEDPAEVNDLAADPDHADLVAELDQELRMILDPEEVDLQAKEDQEYRLELAGGREHVLAGGPNIPYTPAPSDITPQEKPNHYSGTGY